jgi:hypothetical protein
MNNQLENLAEKTKLNVTRFAMLGGSAAVVGLIATSEHLATNPTAQNVGLYSALVAGVALGGALWQFATYEDKKRELETKSPSFSSSLDSIRNKYLNRLNKSNKPNML